MNKYSKGLNQDFPLPSTIHAGTSMSSAHLCWRAARFHAVVVTSMLWFAVYLGVAVSLLSGHLAGNTAAVIHTHIHCGTPSAQSSSALVASVSRSSDTVRRMLRSYERQPAGLPHQEASGGVQQQWHDFWTSGLPAGLEALQSLRDQLSMSKYQQLKKDLEPQDTAGVDIALSDTVHNLAQQTHLEAAQEWLRNQTTAEVFKVLNALQHPPDCASARKLVCVLNKGCGFGCEIHHVVHCLTHAVALNRTMVLQADQWNYAPAGNGTEVWEHLMAPVSSCGMHSLSNETRPAIGEGQWHEDAHEVSLGIADGTRNSLEIPSMPPDVLWLVRMFSSRPEHWWVGVLSSYLLRPSLASMERLATHRYNSSWSSPVVGVHIRRTDKITSGEAKLHSVDEYMLHVEHYCDWRLGSGWQQRATPRTPNITSTGESSHTDGVRCAVYLATDDANVALEVSQRFPHMHVITNPVGLTTGNANRNSKEGAQGIYDDIILLASTDFLVGTFSSQVSRLAYEVALVNGTNSTLPVTDRSLEYHSVDSMWYFGGMLHYEFCTKRDYTLRGQRLVKAGQHVRCSAMHEFQAGFIKCVLLPGNQPINLPPALLERCKSFTQNNYRHILPPYMQPPGKPSQQEAGQPLVQ